MPNKLHSVLSKSNSVHMLTFRVFWLLFWTLAVIRFWIVVVALSSQNCLPVPWFELRQASHTQTAVQVIPKQLFFTFQRVAEQQTLETHAYIYIDTRARAHTHTHARAHTHMSIHTSAHTSTLKQNRKKNLSTISVHQNDYSSTTTPPTPNRLPQPPPQKKGRTKETSTLDVQQFLFLL